MSINVAPNVNTPVTLTPGVKALLLNAPNHAVTGTDNVASVVLASLESLSLSSYSAQVNDDKTIAVTRPAMSLTEYASSVDFTPVQGNVTVDAGSDSLVMTAHSVGAVAPNSVAEADWQARISGPNVVWYNDFRSAAEVDAFRWTGGVGGDPNDTGDPGKLILNTSDGVTGGGCLESIRPISTSEGPVWWRPFAPFAAASTGRSTDDPAASGSISLKSWTNTQNAASNFDQAWYGHPSYHSGNNYDGHEFYCQLRVKWDPRRFDAANNSVAGGKHIWFTEIENAQSNVGGEHVVYPNKSGNDGTGKNYFRLYVQNVAGIGAYDPLDQYNGVGLQPGSESATDWSFSGGWDTLLFHIRPGVAGTATGQDSCRLQVWAAHAGVTTYTKIYDLEYEINGWSNETTHKGLQSIRLGSYHNNQNVGQEFFHRYDQIIFSKGWIPCPNDAGDVPAWFSSLANKQAVSPASNWLGATGVKDPSNPGGNSGHSAIIDAWTGMGADQDRRSVFMLHNGGHNDYYGNEVYELNLSASSPAWVRRRDASTATGSGSIKKFADGRPCSDHTTNLTMAAEHRWFTPGMASTNYLGSAGYAQWWEYHHADEDYIDLGGSHTGGGLSVKGLALFDPATRYIVNVFDNNYVPSITYTSIDNMSGSPDEQSIHNLSTAQPVMGAIDTTNKILFVRTGSTYQWMRIDTQTNRENDDWKAISPSGTAPNQKHQFHWHEASQAFITWGGGNTIKVLRPVVSAGQYTSMAWESSVTVTGESLPSSGPAAGMYNKIQLIQDMGNGDSALVITPQYSNPDTFVIRITGAL